MRQSLRYASWLLLLFILLSCSHRVTGEATALPPILQAEAQSQKYNLQLDFMKHHFSGMLIVRQMPDNEIRILGSTYFGLSLFDFSLHRDTFNLINSVPLQMPSACNLKRCSSVFSNRINSCSSGVSSGLMADRNLEEAICTYCKGWLAICSALSFIICKVQTPGTTGCPGK